MLKPNLNKIRAKNSCIRLNRSTNLPLLHHTTPSTLDLPTSNPRNHPTITDMIHIIRSNNTITTHMRNGAIEAAIDVFNSMEVRNVVSWNSIISGCISNGRFDVARKVFNKMPVRDMYSWNLMVRGYVREGNMNAARAVFDRMPERDVVTWNTMVSGYAWSGHVEEARELFDRMPERNTISWNGVLAVYVGNGRMDEARALFESREEWELVAWNCLMGGFVKKMRLVEARELFESMVERDVVSWNTMIAGYAQKGEMLEAERLFRQSPRKDVFTWTSMVSGYAQTGMLNEARRVFYEMPEKNAVSWNAMIAGHVRCKRMDLAREIFEVMPCHNVSSWNTMITGYTQAGDIALARSFFDRMPVHDTISWSAMIAGCAQKGHGEEALHLFVAMRRDGSPLNKSVVTCVLSTCADIGVMELGKQAHGLVAKSGFETGTYVGNALVALYCKCGSIEEAAVVFESIREKDSVSWNTMIAGYARHGFGNEALEVFQSMTEHYCSPDDATMVAVLSACGHAGLLDKGRQYFDSMYHDYGVMTSARHYTCMIDLLGRAGKLDEALDLVKSMPFEPDSAAWGALLGASRVHGNTELAEKAAKIVFEMEPDNSGMYILLSNLYAASGRWKEVGEMRMKMRHTGVRKLPGYSWVEVRNKIHVFSAGNSCHPDKEKIYAFLEDMELRMKEDGYVSSTKSVLHDVDEEEKQHMIKYHSERIAIAFAILTLPRQVPIRVMKNLRVCQDCHTAIKHMSKLVGRLIVLRDSNRFHHFKEGSCSCGDYW
ncbi:hypothetical protein Droror1_Dr00026734 [Drosera rotundifolia]